MARATVFNRDPAAQAHAFETQGFDYLHVVDLDGAFAGKPMNVAAVERILETVGLCRCSSAAASATWRRSKAGSSKGVNRVIIGTAAVRDPALVKEAAQEISRSASRSASMRATARSRSRAGPRPSELTVLDIARRFEDAGVAAIIYTDIARDGMLQGHQLGRDDRARRCGLDSGDRVGRARLDRRHRAHAAAARAQARRRDRRPRALRRAPRSGRSARAACAPRGARLMFKVRVIPCLDVKDGRVVKGVNFVDLRDAGDPVEAAIAYDAAGADELTLSRHHREPREPRHHLRRGARAPPRPASCR